MNKLKLFILYKDKTIKSYSIKKWNKINLRSNKIKYIMIPYLDNTNVYIPIKPSKIYDFYKVSVKLLYQVFTYDYEEGMGESFSEDLYENECYDIVSFINAIYNLYKFRAISIVLHEGRETFMSSGKEFNTITIYPRRIIVDFYNNNNEKINEIDSGIMSDLSTWSSDDFIVPPVYSTEDRFDCLSDFLFIPTIEDDYQNNDTLKNLPIGIKITDANWCKINRPGKELEKNDIFFYKLDDFCAYYIMPYELYIKLLNINRFSIYFIGAALYGEEKDLFLPSYDNPKNMMYSERMKAIEMYFNDDIFDVYGIVLNVFSVSMFLIAMIYTSNIFLYLRYMMQIKMEIGDGLRDLIYFNKENSSIAKGIVLIGDEVNFDNIMKALLSIM